MPGAYDGAMLIQTEIEQKLRASFHPVHMEVVNESHLHGGAAREPGRVRESHFKAVVVAAGFDGVSLPRQHQQVYQSLGDTMSKIHALGLHTFTPAQWQARGGAAPQSPVCPKREKDHHHA